MKYSLPIFLYLLFFSPVTVLFAQITAGDVPAGQSVVDPLVDFEITTPQSIDSLSFDIDCDGVPDMTAILETGLVILDIPNTARILLLDSTLEMCMDTGIYQPSPVFTRYYDFGDSLLCSGEYQW